MAAEPDEVIFESPLLKLRGTGKRIVKFGSSNSWQEKYFVLQKHCDVPFLVYYNKKPKNKNAIPRGKICLKPSFRVEKSMNAKNRAYVFEVTTPVRHLCLSADEQKVMDLFVFFLQIQVKLSSNIIDDFFIVQPENSEAHRRIGARGTCCMFHIAPWGVTLALQNSRAVLAQWPLKSVRCYESNGNGQFILEAGRIAPMGDGVYVFNTRSQDDNAMYDLLDKYVLSATAALRGHHPNNQEQYNDLQLERDRLNALTSVTSDLCLNSELSQATIQNYNYRLQGFTQLPNTPQPTPDLVNRALPNEEYLDSRGYLHPTSSVRQPPLSNDRPPPIALTNEMFGVRSRQDPNRNNLDFKPPPVVSLPKSSEISSSPSKYSLAKSQSYEESSVGASVNGDSVDGYLDMRQSTDSLDLVSSRVVSATPKSPAHTDWCPPPSFSEATRVSAGSYAGLKVTPSGQSLRKGEKMRQVSPSMKVILPSVTSTWSKSSGVHTPGTPSGSVSGAFTVGPVLPAEDTSYLNPRASEPDPSLPSSKGKAKPPVAPRGKIKGLESPATTPRPRHRMMRLKSRSAEDVSDFQKAVYANTEQSVEHSSSDTYMHSGKTTPEPFTDMGPFQNKSHSPDVRERGRRFLKNEKSQSAALESGTMPASHLRRHSQTRQQNLRRSVSNPNFWDHETKDIITKREKTYKNYSCGTPSLGKSTARSLASLLPGALKRHLSRENNTSNYDDWNEGSSRSRSGSNDFRPRSSSFTKSASDIPSSNFTREFRRSSYGSKDSLSTSFKGIRMSEKSRSFRKQKSVTSTMSRQASEVSGAGSISPTGTESGAGTPSINGHGSPVMSPTFDTNSLRKKNLMAGRRLPSLPDEKEKKRESAC